jgi:hypothetical protein
MAQDLSTALKDAGCKIRSAGTPITVGSVAGTGLYIAKGKQTVRGYIETTALNITTGNTYTFKFQEDAALGGSYNDIVGGILVTAVGRKYATFQINSTSVKPYVRFYITCAGGSSSWDGNIYICDADNIA